MNINLPKRLADKLQAIADRSDRTPEAVLDDLIAEHENHASKLLGSFAALAESAVTAGIHSASTVDTATRSRDILTREYADYLKQRTRDNRVSAD